MSTARQIEANAQNAQCSTGPRTAAGKAASSGNALRHGAYASKPVAIPRGLFAEDAIEVSEFVDGIVAALAPRDALEAEHAWRIAMSSLRLRRVGRFETEALSHNGTRWQDESDDEWSERAAVAALRGTIEDVTRIDARISQGLDRALVVYVRLQERPLDSLREQIVELEP